MVRAIIIPANPGGKYGRRGSRTGSILAHEMFADRNEHVMWDLSSSAKGHDDIRHGYFYDTSVGAVTHHFEIDYFGSKKGLKPSDQKFIPPWRETYWTSVLYCIKIKNIRDLKRHHKISEFRSFKKEIIVCKTAKKELKRKISNDSRIRISEYRFAVEFPTLI